MSRNGLGIYTLPAGNPVVTGTVISSTTQNNTMTDVAIALTQSLAYDGQTVPIANLPMGGYKHTGAADGSSAGDYTTIRQLAASSGASLSGYTPGDTGAVATTVQAQLRLVSIMVNSLPAGYVTDGSVDYTTQIQQAFINAGTAKKMLYVPAGTWKYSTVLTIPGNMPGIYGDGQGTVFNPNGCDGMTFATQGSYLGSRSFRDFVISGTSTMTSNRAIVCDFTAASNNQIDSVSFHDISIHGFNKAVYARGMWYCSFYDVFAVNCWIGWHFDGQNIQPSLTNCQAQLVGATGTGSSVGCYVTANSGESTQEPKLINFAAYGFDYGIEAVLVQRMTVIDGDYSEINKACISIFTNSGGVTVRDTWCQLSATAGATAIGIQVASLGAANYDKILIDNNEIYTDAHATGQIGVSIGGQQLSVSVTNNRIGATATANQFDIGIYNAVDGGSANATIKTNTISATTTEIQTGSSATNNTIGPNYSAPGTSTPTSVVFGTKVGLKYYASGAATYTLTGFSATTSGTIRWEADGATVKLLTASSSPISGTSNATTMTGSGLPSYLWPASQQSGFTQVEDNGAFSMGTCVIKTDGTISFFKDIAGNAFTATGTKGVIFSSFTYMIGS